MTDEDLQRPYSHYQPNDPPHNPAPVLGWITGNTNEHYEEHSSWLGNLRQEIARRWGPRTSGPAARFRKLRNVKLTI
jgi:hypothetical protein